MLLGPPDPPRITNNETELSGRNVTIMWRTSDNCNCEIIMYTLYYRIVGPAFKDENWSSVTIKNTRYALQLQYSKEYEITVSAWNKLGRSNSTEWHLRTAQGKNVLKSVRNQTLKRTAARKTQTNKDTNKQTNKHCVAEVKNAISFVFGS